MKINRLRFLTGQPSLIFIKFKIILIQIDVQRGIIGIVGGALQIDAVK
jgi:hypothetical protein